MCLSSWPSKVVLLQFMCDYFVSGRLEKEQAISNYTEELLRYPQTEIIKAQGYQGYKLLLKNKLLLHIIRYFTRSIALNMSLSTKQAARTCCSHQFPSPLRNSDFL